MWAQRTLTVPRSMGSVVYVAASDDVAHTLNTIAPAVGLTDEVFEVVSLDTVIEQTRSQHGAISN